MTDITPQRIIDRFNNRVRDYANASISWGSNNYPAGSDASWFGGTTSGVGDTVSAYDIQAITSLYTRDITETVTTGSGKTATTTTTVVGQDTYASSYGFNSKVIAVNVISALQAHLNLYSRIQQVRIRTFRSRSGYSNNAASLIVDSTADANLTDEMRLDNNVADGTLANGNDIEWAHVYDFIERCRSRVWSLKTYTQRTLTNTVCHDSCHSSCHSNRGRR